MIAIHFESRHFEKNVRITIGKSNYHLRVGLRRYICNIYNMSGRVVSNIQTRAGGESLYTDLIQHGRECCK